MMTWNWVVWHGLYSARIAFFGLLFQHAWLTVFWRRLSVVFFNAIWGGMKFSNRAWYADTNDAERLADRTVIERSLPP